MNIPADWQRMNVLKNGRYRGIRENEHVMN